ncbi:hypothetical protein GA0070558_13512 [Micromonospora haikouensis]|uniref:Uncharacterized protein n=1 Tax=Micromonospora haikouensis TaxID=686309 RepID=A0A1C4Y4M4_9ACTN|nr:hypothetical protein GA0070558_13512 [Micromonospora haikouensis]
MPRTASAAPATGAIRRPRDSSSRTIRTARRGMRIALRRNRIRHRRGDDGHPADSRLEFTGVRPFR